MRRKKYGPTPRCTSVRSRWVRCARGGMEPLENRIALTASTGLDAYTWDANAYSDLRLAQTDSVLIGDGRAEPTAWNTTGSGLSHRSDSASAALRGIVDSGTQGGSVALVIFVSGSSSAAQAPSPEAAGERTGQSVAALSPSTGAAFQTLTLTQWPGGVSDRAFALDQAYGSTTVGSAVSPATNSSLALGYPPASSPAYTLIDEYATYNVLSSLHEGPTGDSLNDADDDQSRESDGEFGLSLQDDLTDPLKRFKKEQNALDAVFAELDAIELVQDRPSQPDTHDTPELTPAEALKTRASSNQQPQPSLSDAARIAMGGMVLLPTESDPNLSVTALPGILRGLVSSEPATAGEVDLPIGFHQSFDVWVVEADVTGANTAQAATSTRAGSEGSVSATAATGRAS